MENKIKDFDKDLQRYESQLYCTDCGNDKVDKTFIYNRTVANGEVWNCKECGKENLTDEKPNADNY
jgi:transcription elongation factor Elf1